MRLIDADALKIIKYKQHHPNEEVKAYQMGWNDAVDAIVENAPTIAAEPVRQGKWEAFPFDKEWVRCSECEAMWEKELVANCYMNYCPNCGAKMDEVEECGR